MSAAAKTAEKVVEVAGGEVIEAVAETVDFIEDGIEVLDHIHNLNGTTRRQQIIVLVAVAVVAAGAGAAVSHFVTKKVLKTRFDEMMEEELENTRQFYSRQTVDVEALAHPVDPEELLASIDPDRNKVAVKPEKVDYAAISRGNEFVDEGAKAHVASLSQSTEEPEEAVAVVEKRAFDEDVEIEWVERNERHTAQRKPHIISRDDFFENDNDWSQFTFTYFAGDDVLADEKEAVIPDVEPVVGAWNLERFGWLSEEPNTIYVRVPEHDMEVEVIRSEGTYAAEVHGFTHSDDAFEKVRKGGRVRFGDD